MLGQIYFLFGWLLLIPICDGKPFSGKALFMEERVNHTYTSNKPENYGLTTLPSEYPVSQNDVKPTNRTLSILEKLCLEHYSTFYFCEKDGTVDFSKPLNNIYEEDDYDQPSYKPRRRNFLSEHTGYVIIASVILVLLLMAAVASHIRRKIRHRLEVNLNTFARAHGSSANSGSNNRPNTGRVLPSVVRRTGTTDSTRSLISSRNPDMSASGVSRAFPSNGGAELVIPPSMRDAGLVLPPGVFVGIDLEDQPPSYEEAIANAPFKANYEPADCLPPYSLLAPEYPTDRRNSSDMDSLATENSAVQNINPEIEEQTDAVRDNLQSNQPEAT